MSIITPQMKTLYKSFIDELLSQSGLSLSCLLIYEGSAFVECSNCHIDPLSHKSSNTYKSGGPLVFADGQICPNCRGLGGTYSQVSETLNLLVLHDYKSWIGFDSKVHSPNGMVQTISKLEDYAKIKNCNKAIIDTNIQDYTQAYYQRASELEPQGFGESSYCFTFWKKI